MICLLLTVNLVLFLSAAVRDGGAQWLDSYLSDESGKMLVEFFVRYILSIMEWVHNTLLCEIFVFYGRWLTIWGLPKTVRVCVLFCSSGLMSQSAPSWSRLRCWPTTRTAGTHTCVRSKSSHRWRKAPSESSPDAPLLTLWCTAPSGDVDWHVTHLNFHVAV